VANSVGFYLASTEVSGRGNRPATASSTQISSSSSSQRRALPCTRSFTFSRNCWGAPDKSGYLAAGKLTTRSSESSKHTRRPSTHARKAFVSLLTESSMDPNILSLQTFAMFSHKSLDIPEVGSAVSIVRSERNGTQPELGLQVIASHMNVRRLIPCLL
jgi:hypothetical protein